MKLHIILQSTGLESHITGSELRSYVNNEHFRYHTKHIPKVAQPL